MTGSISKSQMMAGLQCPKRLWREVKQSSSQPMSLAQQHILAQGQEVGRYARQQFANGVLIGAATSEAISATQRAIASGSTCLFEAAFEFEGVFVRCDILQHVAAGWELIEVKSSNVSSTTMRVQKKRLRVTLKVLKYQAPQPCL
ncbi:MAG: hypothetical protein IGR80_11325 [Synechococcales cyanobacterium K44_A2020_017]|nr:hypothetical protein [Synechococcales cyanobacterium K32_A2020_035]MBF2095335.1 hypothetical protein [Synechococcales cyanobacterium K44_A2020_017]